MSDALLSGRYRLLEPLGSGGFGETFVAEDTQFPGHPQCVVKKLKPQLDNPSIWPDACRLFQREAETLSQLGTHDQIPQLLAHFEENEHFYLVQELIRGSDLSKELTASKQASEYYTVNLLQDILEVLEFVHNKGVIHRDIKPSNLIRRDSDGKIVLIDFGAVKSIGIQTTISNSNTAHTVSICTPGYTPNEQYSGQPKLSSDIYSVGMIGIQALTEKLPGEIPKDPETGEILWKEHLNVSAPLAQIIDQMVLYDFRRRYQNASQARTALTQLVTQPISIPVTEPITRVRESVQTVQSSVISVPPSTSLPQQTPVPKPRLPIRTFFVALFLGFIGGTAGTLYGINRFFPSAFSASAPQPLAEKIPAIGGANDETIPDADVIPPESLAPNPAVREQPTSTSPQKPKLKTDQETTAPVAVDYKPLQAALNAGQWKNADQITRDLLLSITGRAGSVLRIEDIETIPCAEFNVLNQLWTQASQGRFGFQAQQLAWQGLVGKSNESENVSHSNAKSASREFMLRTLWGYEKYGRFNFQEYKDLIFSINAPTGHLPVKALLQTKNPDDSTRLTGVEELIPSLTQRVTFCSQSQNS